MYDLPTQPGLVQCDGSTIEKSGSIVEVEARNRDVFSKLITTRCARGKGPWIEYGRVIIER
jgi:hypothetical protein